MKRTLLLALVATFVLAAPAAGQTPPDNTPPTVPADADGDGVADASDQCPYMPGTLNGCPDPDYDHDGFPNETDRCQTEAGPFKGCPSPPDDSPQNETVAQPTATSVATSGASLLRSGRRNDALLLSGTPFMGAPSMTVMSPRRLTIWLPKGVTVSGAPAKACSQAFAKSATLTTIKRCAKILAGRLPGGSDDLTAWFAYAGPKQGTKRRLWVRGRGGDDLVGFGTGWIEPAKGAWRTKITVELGQLDMTTRGLEVFSAPERATAGMVRPLRGSCQKFRMQLETAQGKAVKTFRC